MHALDVAHSMFALSLQGGATVRVNLGQTPFRFDVGAALAAPRSSDRASRAADDDDRASVASSAGALSIGGASGRGWRTSIAGESAQSRMSGSSGCRSDGGGGDAIAAVGGGGFAAADRIAAQLRQLARNWSARSYGSEVDEDVRTALWRLGSDIRRRDSASAAPGGLEGVLAWLGIAGSARE